MKDFYSEKYDFPDYHDLPKKIICVYFIPRSGSNYLADEMRKTGKLGFPLEYFSEPHMNDMAERMPGMYYHNLTGLFKKRTSSNGVFSYKWNSNFNLLSKLINNQIIPHHCFFIDRLDKREQAKSYYYAKKTGDWNGRFFDYPYPHETDLHKARLELSIIRFDTEWLIKDIDYTTIYYEIFAANPEMVINRMLQEIEA